MYFLDISKYSNHLDLFEISSKEIENQIATIRLTFINKRNDEAEWKIQFPTFVGSFYKYIYNKWRWRKNYGLVLLW